MKSNDKQYFKKEGRDFLVADCMIQLGEVNTLMMAMINDHNHWVFTAWKIKHCGMKYQQILEITY